MSMCVCVCVSVCVCVYVCVCLCMCVSVCEYSDQVIDLIMHANCPKCPQGVWYQTSLNKTTIVVKRRLIDYFMPIRVFKIITLYALYAKFHEKKTFFSIVS